MKFKVKYVYEEWYDLNIEAPSLEEAKEKFWFCEWEEEPREVGGEVQEGVRFEEVSA